MKIAPLEAVVLTALCAVPGTGSLFAQTEYSRVAQLIGTGKVSAVLQLPQTQFAARLPKEQAGAAVLSPLLGGAIAAAKTGGAIREEHQFGDPVAHFRDAFLGKLGEQRAIEIVLVPEPVTEDPAALRARLSTELALDFKTVVWTLAVHGDQHRIEYWGRVRLIRLDGGQVLWKETCKFRTPDPKANQRTLDDLLRDDAALLNEEFIAATAQCAARLASP